MQIIDYVIIGVIALFLLIGIIRGMIKMTFGLVAGLASLVIAVMLTTTVAGVLVQNTPIAKSIAEGLSSSINIGGTAVLVYDETNPEQDILGYYKDNEDGSRTFYDVKTLFEGNAFLKLFDKVIENGIRESYTKEVATESAKTLSSVLCAWLAVIILQAICFIVLWILCAIILKIISMLLKKLVGLSYVGHFLDRILGGAMGAGIAVILVMLAFTLMALVMQLDFMAPVKTQIESSIVGKALYDNNFIYKLISQKIDINAIAGSLAGIIK